MTFSVHIHVQSRRDSFSEIARSDAEVETLFERLLAAGTYFHNPSMYVVERPTYGPAEVPDHAMKLDVDVAANLGALAYAGPEPDGGPWISLSDTPHPEVELYQDLGSGYRFPSDAVIPLSVVREAVLEFRRSGGQRPTCVQWQEAEGF